MLDEFGGGFDGTINLNGINISSEGGRTDGFIMKYGNTCLTGIDDFDVVKNKITIFPNSALDKIILRLDAPLNLINALVEIHDLSGRLLQSEEIIFGKKEHEIFLKVRTPGMYYFLLKNDNGLNESGKFVVYQN